MPRIAGEIIIGRPVDVVFDYVADQTNEPEYNPRMVLAEKITEGPVGKGTRFRSAVAAGQRPAQMLIEYTGYDRPRQLQSEIRMNQAEFSYQLTFEPALGGTRMRWAGQIRPKGGWRIAGPLIQWLGTRQERRIWTAMKRQLETGSATAQPAPSSSQ
jgi:hypothetical protein